MGLLQCEGERAPSSHLALDPYLPAVSLDDLLADPEPESRPFDLLRLGVVDAREFLEELPLLIRRDPYPLVGHRDDKLVGGVMRRPYRHFSPRGGILHGV